VNLGLAQDASAPRPSSAIGTSFSRMPRSSSACGVQRRCDSPNRDEPQRQPYGSRSSSQQGHRPSKVTLSSLAPGRAPGLNGRTVALQTLFSLLISVQTCLHGSGRRRRHPQASSQG
jgi:hypothetical protein